MKRKIITCIIALFAIVLFLEAQYHIFHRANRYWHNNGTFSTDNRIQTFGTNNALRVAYNNSVYREFTVDSDGELDLDGPMYLNYAPTGTSGFNLIEVDYDVEGIVTNSARGIYSHVTNRSDTAITGELTGGEFKVRSQDSNTTSVKGIHVSIDAKANTITTGRGIEISIDDGDEVSPGVYEHGEITTAQGLRVAHNSSGAHTTIQGIIVEGPGTWTDGIALAGTFTDGIDFSAGSCTTDIKLQNGETIYNSTNGIINILGRIEFDEIAIAHRGSGTYLFADELAVGNEGIPGDAQGVCLKFDWGTTPDLSGSGRMVHGLDVRMDMDQDWSFTTSKHNAVIRGARIQGLSTDNVGGKVMGAYINARANGPGSFDIEGIISGAIDGPGMVSIEARTEIGNNTVITTPAVAGIMCYHRGMTGSDLKGDYMAVYLHQPYHPTHTTGNSYGVWFANDGGTGDPYDYAFGFSSELDANAVAHYNSGFSTDGTGTIDGWIKVEIDGHPLYIYLWPTTPS